MSEVSLASRKVEDRGEEGAWFCSKCGEGKMNCTIPKSTAKLTLIARKVRREDGSRPAVAEKVLGREKSIFLRWTKDER